MNPIHNFPPIYPDLHEEKISEYFSAFSSPDDSCRGEDMLFGESEAFFICFTNRCGSNFVAQALSSDGKLPQAGENLNFDTVIKQSKKRGFQSFNQYLHWLVSFTSARTNKFGAKLSAGQLLSLYNKNFLGSFKSPPKFIHVIRRDVISQAISLYIASKTNKWTSLQDGVDAKIEYDPEALIKIVSSICYQNAMFQSLFQLLNLDSYVVFYEEFISQPDTSVTDIGNFLNIKNLNLIHENLTYRKQANDLNKQFLERFKNDYSL